MTDRAQLEKETEYVQDLPGFKRGNPHYFSDPMIGKLLEIMMMMGGELWTVKHRQAITERLLGSNQPVSPDDIETFLADDEFKEQVEMQRQKFIKSLFKNLYDGDWPDPNERYLKWVTREDKDES